MAENRHTGQIIVTKLFNARCTLGLVGILAFGPNPKGQVKKVKIASTLWTESDVAMMCMCAHTVCPCTMEGNSFWCCTLYPTLLFQNILTQKNKDFLILPSSLSRYSSAPKTKIIFQMLWCVFEIIQFIHFYPMF